MAQMAQITNLSKEILLEDIIRFKFLFHVEDGKIDSLRKIINLWDLTKGLAPFLSNQFIFYRTSIIGNTI